MRKILSAALAASILIVTVPAKAATLDFIFTFTNQSTSGSGLVTGIVRGLLDDAIGPAASLEITDNTDGFGIGEYIGNPDTNTWQVASGVINSSTFLSYGTNNAFPDATCCTLSITFIPLQSSAASLTNSPDSVSSRQAPLTITFEPSSPVPVPTALPLFASGLGVMGLLGWRRKRKKVAAAATA